MVNEEGTDEKRPSRNRPKKIPNDFVATPSRTRRQKTVEPENIIMEVQENADSQSDKKEDIKNVESLHEETSNTDSGESKQQLEVETGKFLEYVEIFRHYHKFSLRNIKF